MLKRTIKNKMPGVVSWRDRFSWAAYWAKHAPELLTYIDGLTTPLSLNDKIRIGQFMIDIKTGMGIENLSEAFDWAFLLNNETSEASVRNIIKDDFHGTLSGATLPTFTKHEGVAGNGTNSYIDVDYKPLTDKSAFLLDSSSFGVFSNTDVDNTGNSMGVRKASNDDRILIYLRYNNQSGYYLNTDATSGGLISNMNSLGMHIITRTANNLTTYYKDKVSKGTSVNVSSALPDYNVSVLAVNTAGSIGAFDTRQLGFVFMGRGLSQADVNVITDAYNAYRVFF